MRDQREDRWFQRLLGSVLVLGTTAVFLLEHLRPGAEWTWPSIAGHAVFLFVGLLIMLPARAKWVAEQISAHVPSLKRGMSRRRRPPEEEEEE